MLASRLIAATLAVSGLSNAPFQCRREADPAHSLEETAGDALWELARRFAAQHNVGAERETLRLLVERCPSNRHAPAAKVQLCALEDGGL